MNQEHLEAAMVEDILRAVSELHLEEVLLVEMALRAGWLSDHERARLTPLADSFMRLGQS